MRCGRPEKGRFQKNQELSCNHVKFEILRNIQVQILRVWLDGWSPFFPSDFFHCENLLRCVDPYQAEHHQFPDSSSLVCFGAHGRANLVGVFS